MSAKYQIGFPYEDLGIHMYEIRDMMVTLDVADKPKPIQYEDISIKYVIKSQNF